MDVQAAAPTATILSALAQTASAQPSTPPSNGVTVAAAQSALSAVSGTDSASSDGSTSSNSGASNGASNGSSIGPTPGLATLPAGPPDGTKKGKESEAGLASGIATLYNVQEQNIAVSFEIEQNPNEIVTVFTDKQTGKVIVQFPSETMIALAKLFDKLDGSVVNKKV
jgi:flagellar protein FlaG